MIEKLDISVPAVARQVLTLQRLAYQIEADLIGFDGIPPLHESLVALMSHPLTWRGIRKGRKIVAALAYTVDGGICDIDRLVVDPEHFGRGYGSLLVSSLFEHSRIIVQTGTANLPARRLYEKAGFRPLRDIEVYPGVTVTQYERRSCNAS